MNRARVLYHMARADFLERVRRYSFLLTLAGALYLAYAVATEKMWILVGNEYRGVYNSAWIGMLMTICCSTWLSLVGFYIVKNSIRRDSDTRVGQILAATPMPKAIYTLAKTLSNFAVLACMVLVLMLAALAMQFLRPEARPISLWQLWSPFVLVALPAMLLTASLALLFETLPVLRSGVGNVLYFFLWTALLAMGGTGTWDDPSGLRLLYRSTRAALHVADSTSPSDFQFSLTIGGTHAAHTFVWSGIDWTAQLLLNRVFWVAAAAGLALLASVFFTRFDPAKEWFRRRSRSLAASPALAASEDTTPMSSPVVAITSTHLTAMLRASGRLCFPQLVASELRLMLKGQPWWWYVVACGLLIAELTAPLSAARQGVLLAAWIWPILLWSQMGCRETRHATTALLFSSERALTRQLPALWTAGGLLTALTGAGVGVRLMLIVDWQSFAAWIAAVLFIPSLALALGIWSGSSVPFEALYTVWWYVGPGHQLPGLDFMGTTLASARPQYFALAAAILFALSYWRRRHPPWIRVSYTGPFPRMQQSTLLPPRIRKEYPMASPAVDFARNNQQRFLGELKDLLRIPSVSTLDEHKSDVQKAADFVANELRRIGMENVGVIPTKGHPLIYADWLHAQGKPTALCYAHYDVQPPDPLDEWHTPPFEPTERNNNIYARGAVDDKGQLWMEVKALESLLKSGNGKLPINVKVIFEGEEEVGGESITEYVYKQKSKLKADFALVCDTELFAPNLPTLCVGLRGLVYTEIEATGAKVDLHSGIYGGAAPNPFFALVEIISKLKDAKGKILIPGFYKGVKAPSKDELKAWKRLPFNEEHYRKTEVGSKVLTGEPGYSVLYRTWARPTLEVHGMPGGFIAVGAKTVIPAKAAAKVSMRLVPNQDPDDILKRYTAFVKKLTPKGIETKIKVWSKGPASVVSTDNPYIKAATEALRDTFKKETVFIRSGGSIPIVNDFQQALKIPSVMMGFGLPDDNLHAPNEKFHIPNFHHGIETICLFFEKLGEK